MPTCVVIVGAKPRFSLVINTVHSLLGIHFQRILWWGEYHDVMQYIHVALRQSKDLLTYCFFTGSLSGRYSTFSNSLIKYLSYSSGVINTFRGSEIFVAVDEGYSRLYFLVVFILISSSRWIIACMATIKFIDVDLTCSNHPAIPV